MPALGFVAGALWDFRIHSFIWQQVRECFHGLVSGSAIASPQVSPERPVIGVTTQMPEAVAGKCFGSRFFLLFSSDGQVPFRCLRWA